MTAARPYRDSSGRTLQDYPRPSVAVDTAVLTPHEGRLSVLLVRDEAGDERLPGTFLHPGETLQEAALRALREKAGVQGLHPHQLHVFDDPGRDDRGWVLSVAHLDAVRSDTIPLTDHSRLVPVDEELALKYDHWDIVTAAKNRLRNEYRRLPDPWSLLSDPRGPITIRELRLLHVAVLGEPLVADTFRRAMLPRLRPTGGRRQGVVGKPAELYEVLRDGDETSDPAEQ